MKVCTVDGCNLKHKAKGYCLKHYERFTLHGDPLGGGIFRVKNELCKVDGCNSKAKARNFCIKHWNRDKKYGDHSFAKNTYGRFKDWAVGDGGYIQRWEPENLNSCSSGYLYQHRHVMSEKIGRNLRKKENVHHINGDKTDNRPENLELWITTQPAGQRADDKVRHAIQVIKDHYDVAVLADEGIKIELETLILTLKKDL